MLDRLETHWWTYYVGLATLVAVGTLAYGELITLGALMGTSDYSLGVWLRLAMSGGILVYCALELSSALAMLLGVFGPMVAGLMSSLLMLRIGLDGWVHAERTGDWKGANELLNNAPGFIDSAWFSAGWWNYVFAALAFGPSVVGLIRDYRRRHANLRRWAQKDQLKTSA